MRRKFRVARVLRKVFFKEHPERPMRAATRFALTALVLVSGASGATGCFQTNCETSSFGDAPTSDGAGAVGGPTANAGTAAIDPGRAISEADIVQLDHEQNYVYAISKSGSLAIVDASKPGVLALLGTGALSGQPFEMYRRGSTLVTMSNNGVDASGVVLSAGGSDAAPGAAPVAPDPRGSALISAIDVSDPTRIRTLSTFKVPGEIADSRVVGDILYLATFENGACYGCEASQPRTLVTTFDIGNATSPKVIDQVVFQSPNGGGSQGPWATPWKRSIVATTDRLYVGGLASSAITSADEGVIEVLDISDPGGHLVRGAKLSTSGPVLSRWQMDEHDGVLRVVSQRGVGRTTNGERYPDVDTFRIDSTSSMPRIGHMTMSLPRQEGLKTVRFDGPRGYAITFNQSDPLFTFDLADPANPTQKGELVIPGWIYHLEPRGDRLVGLGLDRRDPEGNLNVSLIDVSDLANPTLIDRESFGPTSGYTDQDITSGVLAEDQDRIQKAFRIFDDGLIVIPYSGGTSYGQDTCQSRDGGVQLMEYTSSTLTRRAVLPVAGNPRRAIRRDSAVSRELIAVSDSNVTSFSIELRDAATRTADVVIGACVPRTTSPNGNPQGGWGGDGWEGNDVSGVGKGRVWNGSTCE
jgi:hypothetical protein